jgi:hypothetical protein
MKAKILAVQLCVLMLRSSLASYLLFGKGISVSSS